MELNFQYSKEKDIWCILNKGKSSNNSQAPTKVYGLHVQSCGENPTAEDFSAFDVVVVDPSAGAAGSYTLATISVGKILVSAGNGPSLTSS